MDYCSGWEKMARREGGGEGRREALNLGGALRFHSTTLGMCLIPLSDGAMREEHTLLLDQSRPRRMKPGRREIFGFIFLGLQ